MTEFGVAEGVISVVDDDGHSHDNSCWADCDCGRGRYRSCHHRSCYECYLDRLSDYLQCIYCGRWHSPGFDTCFKCRPQTQGRDDAARALRQLILWRDDYTCSYCQAREGDARIDRRRIRPRCPNDCQRNHNHRLRDDDGLYPVILHVDHIVPCAAGGLANEWNLQTLCSVCNIAKGATWYPGCRHDDAKTLLCKRYLLIASGYFREHEREEFMVEWRAFRATGTWDPQHHRDWRQAAPAESR